MRVWKFLESHDPEKLLGQQCSVVAAAVHSEVRRGFARDREVAWTRERRGTVERMMSIRAQGASGNQPGYD